MTTFQAMPDMGFDHIIGLDLSLTATGFALIGEGVTKVQTLRTTGKKDATLFQRADRLEGIVQEIMMRIPALDSPAYTAIAIEGPSMGHTTGHHHDRSGLWWLVVCALIGQGYIVSIVTPTQAKKYVTGKGNAGKAEVMLAVAKRYPEFDISNDNEADAVALATLLARAVGQPIEKEDLPKVNLAALDKFAVAP